MNSVNMSILTIMTMIDDTDAISDTDAIRDTSAVDDNNAINNTNATVSFHNFKSQNFKLSVSNPKNTYASYLCVRSQISNCQSLGRNNKHEILKTDRIHDTNAARLWRPCRASASGTARGRTAPTVVIIIIMI